MENPRAFRYRCEKCGTEFRQRSQNSKCPRCGTPVDPEAMREQVMLGLIISVVIFILIFILWAANDFK